MIFSHEPEARKATVTDDTDLMIGERPVTSVKECTPFAFSGCLTNSAVSCHKDSGTLTQGHHHTVVLVGFSQLYV